MLKWARDNDAPKAKHNGETLYDYRNRLWEWINDGRPAEKPAADDGPVIGWSAVDDLHKEDMARIDAEDPAP